MFTDRKAPATPPTGDRRCAPHVPVIRSMEHIINPPSLCDPWTALFQQRKLTDKGLDTLTKARRSVINCTSLTFAGAMACEGVRPPGGLRKES
jgi:hypothetical protein